MNQDKIDRWGSDSGYDQEQSRRSLEMAAIQQLYQDASLRKLRARLEAAGIGWDYKRDYKRDYKPATSE